MKLSISFLFIIIIVLISVAFLTLLERKVMGSIQRRRGPNDIGAFGLLQPFADGLKLFLKEFVIPIKANKILFIIAPTIFLAFSLMNWALLPLSFGLVIADLNLGLLFVLAISSFSVYGLILGGWASNSQYAFLGALRSAAQMISYEISLSLLLFTVVILSKSLNLTTMISMQEKVWFVFPLLPVFLLFFVSSLAETSRPPFDLPEAEAELVAGYNVEYASMGFAFFFIAEYTNIIFMCFLAIILFFGGWLISAVNITFINFFPTTFWLFIKASILLILFIWIRASLPRFRYDQLMTLAWRQFLIFSFVMFTMCFIMSLEFTLLFAIAGGTFHGPDDGDDGDKHDKINGFYVGKINGWKDDKHGKINGWKDDKHGKINGFDISKLNGKVNGWDINKMNGWEHHWKNGKYGDVNGEKDEDDENDDEDFDDEDFDDYEDENDDEDNEDNNEDDDYDDDEGEDEDVDEDHEYDEDEQHDYELDPQMYETNIEMMKANSLGSSERLISLLKAKYLELGQRLIARERMYKNNLKIKRNELAKEIKKYENQAFRNQRRVDREIVHLEHLVKELERTAKEKKRKEEIINDVYKDIREKEKQVKLKEENRRREAVAARIEKEKWIRRGQILEWERKQLRKRKEQLMEKEQVFLEKQQYLKEWKQNLKEKDEELQKKEKKLKDEELQKKKKD